ncbi:uncharacterized protein LACBIDRAFT_311098 [Laccaria bicolor S238N-H82]|uniref:Predicted protein n=1 Tax=Laccaria bicolor (strain S238N-H82 / ATCC MYA-4686) TaxID=486041 RepID=B0CZ86_LACBS|nr:uncharacterized protein LACBIDRAFT_311098 [Laccaria bicolor S238N-H82]EDR12107.1 predicted protein [Laccaria bicolor S238N-H82]|eukprot:XP_001876371.1 predicted protein [Laccaria bicolor S238N-H82]
MFISRITTPFTFTFRRFHFHNPFHFHFQALSLSHHFQLTFKAPFPALSGLSPFGPLSNLLINIFYRVASGSIRGEDLSSNSEFSVRIKEVEDVFSMPKSGLWCHVWDTLCPYIDIIYVYIETCPKKDIRSSKNRHKPSISHPRPNRQLLK